MLRLVYSNRTERLVQALAERLAARIDPFESLSVVVPSRTVERWLEMRLAESLGIVANVRFERLESFVAGWRARGERGAAPLLGRASIEGRLLALLLDPGTRADPELAPVIHYLDGATGDPLGLGAVPGETSGKRIAQLASRLAHLFEEYSYSRAEMLYRWSGGRLELDLPLERWQRALWIAMRKRGPDALTLPEALRARRVPGQGEPAHRPAHVFGFSYVAPIFHRAFEAIAESGELTVYTLNPSREFWEDAPAERRRRRAPVDEVGEGDNVLLRAFGRPGRDHVALLDEQSGFDAEERWDEPAATTELHRVQRAVLDRLPPELGQPDASIELVAAPSLRRELETIASSIWSLVRDSSSSERPLRFHEIALLVTSHERQRYLPELEAVFAESYDLPWNAVDLSLSERSRVAECALRLVALPGSDFGRASLLELLTHPLVLARWDEAEPGHVAALVDRLGAFRGIDASDHRGTYLDGIDSVHWDQAIRRLALGSVMEGARRGHRVAYPGLHGPLVPEEIDASQSLELGLGLVVRSLANDARYAREAELTPSDWARFFGAMLRAYLVPRESYEEAELRRCTAALDRLAERDTGASIGYRVAYELARAELEALPASRGEPLGHGVAVASLLPMRAFPFRAIFVVGLGEGAFPARATHPGLDLRALRRRPLDVDADERDRYAFLETVLCARDKLVLSYVSRDEETGEPREPSSVIRTLEEALGHALPRRAPRLRRYEESSGIQPFRGASREAMARDHGRSVRAEFADVRVPERALAGLAPHDPRRALLAMPFVPPAIEVEERARVRIGTLIRFLECPIQGHAERIIGSRTALPASADEEPIDVELRVRDEVLGEAFASQIAGRPRADEPSAYDRHVAHEMARGEWPVGPLAELRRAADERVLALWQSKFRRFGGQAVSRVRFGVARESASEVLDRARHPLIIELARGEGARAIELTGRTGLQLADGDALVLSSEPIASGEVGAARLQRLALRAFVEHAVLSAAGLAPSGVRRAWVLDPSDQPPTALTFAPMGAEPALRWLVQLGEELLVGPHGFYLPYEAVFAVEHLFSNGSDRAADELARAIEEVRTKKDGGSSRSGHVRGAVEFPAPEPADALAMVRQRFAAFFDTYRGVRKLG